MLGIVGPILPFRGGIAQHTTMLHRGLVKQTELKTISFVRQYPKAIFPGQSDRDESMAGYVEPGVDYVIDSLNPLSWKKAVDLLISSGVKKVIFPWWTVFWAPCFGYMSRALKKQGVAICFFCHNVVEHETAMWKKILTERVLSVADSFVVHTKIDANNLYRSFPDARVTVHPHPVYDQFPKDAPALERRAELELLFFGFVRRYKGLDVLIDALAKLQDKDFYLSIVGEFWAEKELIQEKIHQFGLSERVEIVDGYVSEQEAASFFQRADAVVLPYRSATGSGVVALAYHYHLPVIATTVGGLPDVIDDGATGFLAPPEDPSGLAEILDSVSAESLGAMKDQITEKKKCFTWESLSKTICENS